MSRTARQQPRERRPLAELPLAAQAAILGQGPAFWRFLNERHGYGVSSPDEAAEAVREICGVSSRRDLLRGSDAGARFFELKGNFDVYMSGVE